MSGIVLVEYHVNVHNFWTSYYAVELSAGNHVNLQDFPSIGQANKARLKDKKQSS